MARFAAEVQDAAQAVDSAEFVVRFWHVLLNPITSLKQISNPSLAPTLITDAKALYNSFHRDAINNGATDKRTNLELRVIREQVEGIGGVLCWISSERQFGSSPTASGSNQTIKFTFDPGYTASKKKIAAQRAKSRNKFTTTTKHNQLSHNHNAADDDEPVNNMSPVSHDVDGNDLSPENNMVPEDAILSENAQTSEYAMMAEYAAEPFSNYFLQQFCR